MHEPAGRGTPDGHEVWVTVRGENYVDVLDARTFQEKTRITTLPGPGMTIFSPDDKYGYVCSSFNPVTDVISVATHKTRAKVKQVSPFCPNIAATPDGKQVWMTLKDSGSTEVFNAKPPFNVLKVLDTGAITNHVNIVDNANGSFAYVTIGGLNEVKLFRTDDFSQVATIPVGALPHGLWPSGDGTRIYVGLENGDGVTAIDTLTNKMIAIAAIGQAPQALTYAPDAVPSGDGMQNLVPLGVAGQATHLAMAAPGNKGSAPTSVTLFNQGLVQVLEYAKWRLCHDELRSLYDAPGHEFDGDCQEELAEVIQSAIYIRWDARAFSGPLRCTVELSQDDTITVRSQANLSKVAGLTPTTTANRRRG
jgi:YVTN family beta-propeller protein